MKFIELLKRIFIYNITLAYLYLNFFKTENDLNKKSNEFKKNFLFSIEKLKLEPETFNLINNILNANSFLIFQSIFGVLLLSSILSIFSKTKIFNFVFVILFGFISAINYNPLLPENKILAPFGIRRELILSVGICIVLCLNIFNIYDNTDDVLQQLKSKTVTLK